MFGAYGFRDERSHCQLYKAFALIVYEREKMPLCR